MSAQTVTVMFALPHRQASTTLPMAVLDYTPPQVSHEFADQL